MDRAIQNYVFIVPDPVLPVEILCCNFQCNLDEYKKYYHNQHEALFYEIVSAIIK